MSFKILDFILVFSLLVFFVVGYKKGLLRSILNLASVLIVTAFVPSISGVTSTEIYDHFLEKKVSSITESLVSNGFSKYPKKQIDKLVKSLDPISSYVLKRSGACNANELILSKTNNEVMNGFIKEKALNYISFLVTLALSFIFLLLFRILFKKFSVKRIPLIGNADAILGSVLGGFECLVLFFVFFKLFSTFCTFFNGLGGNSRVYNNIIESASFKYFKEFDSWNFVK